MNLRFISNTDNDLLVDLPSGKLSSTGTRKALKNQTGMTCTLFAMRRIAFFNIKNKHDQAYQSYKTLKQILSKYNGDHEKMVMIANDIVKKHDIDLEKSLLANESFIEMMTRYKSKHSSSISVLNFYNKLNSRDKWIRIYDILIEKILSPLMNLQNAEWHPRDGYKKLKESLEKNGAHWFMGKFGAWCYSKKPTLSKTSTDIRKVYFFDRDSYIGDNIPFLHGIIIDQVKVVNGKEMVFFRDPYDASSSLTPEKVYMITYETFVNRLTDKQGFRFVNNECANDITFGLVSRCPGKLYGNS